jgi:non-ribosomal peptide synthetase component F
VFVQDLCTSYVVGLGVPAPLPPVPQSYTDWTAAECAFWQPAELKARADYWKNKLAGARQLLPAVNAIERARQPLERWVSSVPQELTGAVRELSRRHGATLFSALLAAFQLTLFKWTGQDDLTVGTPVANRDAASSRQVVGYFSGVVPLRGRVDPSRTLADHVKVAHETAIDGFANAMPFAEMAAALDEPRAKGLHSVFDVRFALHNHPTPDVVLPGISTRLRMRSSGTARFDLACEITEVGKELEVAWLFKSSVFTPISIAGIHKLFREMLAESCNSPQCRIAALNV